MPSTETLWKKPQFGTLNKEKHLSFCEGIAKKKQWVPGSNKYITEVGDWSRNFIEKGKMDKAQKNTFTEEIFKKALKKEKTTPGVGKYNIDRQWKNSSLIVKSDTSYLTKEIKSTFPANEIAIQGHLPASNAY